ncbi:MAG: hypothetical protein K6G42_04085 [Lachnospiraceae bacterium]|nr:hypothetical protein [Lachnospiraceae bacterium]
MVRVKMSDIDGNLTDEEKKEIEEAEKKPVVYDDDSPQMTSEMLKQFHAFDAVPIRVSRETIKKAKSYDRDYAGFLSRLIETAFADKDLLKKCI